MSSCVTVCCAALGHAYSLEYPTTLLKSAFWGTSPSPTSLPVLGVPYDTPEVFFLQGGPLSPTQCRRLHLLKMNSPHICDSERVSPSLPMKGGRPVINAVLAIAIGGDVGGGPPNFQIAFNRIKIERFRCRAVPSSTLCWHLPLRWR